MRKIVFGGANSLDNYIASVDHAVDWLMWCDEAADVTKAYWARFDAVLMGRKTYDVAAKSGAGAGYPGVANYVVSTTLADEDAKGVSIIRDDVANTVRALKDAEGRDICLMGGGELARTLFDEDLIDEIGFNIHPLLLGEGIPLFHTMRRRIDLKLKECRPFKNGCVYVVYDVVH